MYDTANNPSGQLFKLANEPYVQRERWTSCNTFVVATYPQIGGGPRSRTANVYHEGPDLQSGDAHALASRPPKTTG